MFAVEKRRCLALDITRAIAGSYSEDSALFRNVVKSLAKLSVNDLTKILGMILSQTKNEELYRA